MAKVELKQPIVAEIAELFNGRKICSSCRLPRTYG